MLSKQIPPIVLVDWLVVSRTMVGQSDHSMPVLTGQSSHMHEIDRCPTVILTSALAIIALQQTVQKLQSISVAFENGVAL